ncbi:MAG: DEAD/DEAH box helicase [Planctomycetes bacterium]|nr:DEAD/DEAH box helicase [Planctomycetota bacterium]
MEQTVAPDLSSTPVDDQEAYQVLLSRAHRKTGSIPAELLVRHVLSTTADADWPVKREALEALLRRMSFGKTDGLAIASRPAGAKLLGNYSTRRKGSSARPYQTLLLQIDPLDGSCDCPDFLRSSLGICKHLIAVLEDLASKPRLFERAREEASPRPASSRWHPVRPLTGAGDWLAQIHPPVPIPSKPEKRLALVEYLLGDLRDGRREPALHALLLEEQRRLQHPRDVDAPLRTLAALKQRLFPYQREGVRRFLERGRLLLADDMGLGKTAQAIASCHSLWHAGRIRRALIVVPAALKPQWLREWQSFTDAPAKVVDGSPELRGGAFDACKRGFLITNYEQLIRDVDVVRAWKPDLVVLDEAQRMKNWATKTALTVKQLDPPYRLVLTGTPMENRLEELASIVEWVDDLALEPKWRLVPLHMTPGGARNLETLRERLSGCMVRRVRQEVLSQLPERTDARVGVEMTPEQQAAHAELEPSIARLAHIGRKRPLTPPEFLKLMQLLATQRIISNGMAQLNFDEVWPDLRKIERPTESTLKGLASPKLIELRELIEQLVVEQGRKVVVFSQWKRMLKLADWATRSLLARAGARAAFFTGDEGPKKRTQNIVEFHDDPACRVLFASDAGGVGLNLQRAANACINLELPWNPAVLEQRIGRIHRLGQKKPIDVYNLVSEGGIESRIALLVGGKQAIFKGLFDGTSDTVSFEQSGSFLSRIEKVVAPPAEATAEDATDREVDALVAAAEESKDRAPEPDTPAVDVGKLFSALKVEKTKAGGLRIEAPREAAATLAAVFQSFAQLLQAAAK